MARTKLPRKTNKNRNKKDKTLNGNPTALVRFKLPLPRSIMVTLKYTDIFNINAVSGIVNYTYSGNSAFDPDVSGSGTTPYYYSKYAALYKQYVVTRSRFKCTYQVDTGSSQCIATIFVPVYTNNFTGSASGAEEALAMPYAKHHLLVNNSVREENVSMSMNSHTMLNISEYELRNNQTNWTGVSSSPSLEWLWRIICFNNDGGVTAFSISFMITIEYDVIFVNYADEVPPSSFLKETLRSSDASYVSRPPVKE